MRVEHGRDNAGRRLSGNSDHTILWVSQSIHTHTHMRIICAGSSLPELTYSEKREECARQRNFSDASSLHPGSFYFAIYLEKFVRTLGSAIIYSWSQV